MSPYRPQLTNGPSCNTLRCSLPHTRCRFIVQWGIPADPKLYQKWGENKIKDDPVKVQQLARASHTLRPTSDRLGAARC